MNRFDKQINDNYIQIQKVVNKIFKQRQNKKMQVTNRQHIDYFKVFKLLDLKKIDKHGQVKLIQDKYLNRKVLSVEGNVSTQNYIVFDSNQISKQQPTLSFSQRYLYIVGWMEVAKIFCFQIVLNINAKIHRYLFSTVHKSQKMTPQGIMHMPLEFKSGKWRVIVIDLYELCEKHCPIDQARLSFKLASVQIRAHSRIKNIYLSDNFYDPRSLPKDMEMPLRAGQDFYMKYDYACLSTRTDHNELKQQTKQQQQHNPQKNKNTHKHSDQHPKKQPTKLPPSQHPSPNTNNTNTNSKISELNPSKTLKIPHKIKSTTKTTTNKAANKNQTLNQNISFDDDLHDDVMISNHVPKPKTTIKLDLCALEGYTVACHGVKALGAFIVYPSIFAVHKPIKCMSLHPDNAFKLVVGYNDGSICIWDIIRAKPLLYLKTQLPQIKQISLSGFESEQRIYLVGNDRNKRQTILILNNKDILFRQISNYSIHGFLLTSKSIGNNRNSNQNQQLILSYGFENIRLWKINPNNQIITGVGLYLGKMNRNVVYSCACVVRTGLVAVADNCGYVTLVSVDEEKMEEMKKISENGIDLIVNIKQMEKLLIAETSGNIKLLSYTLQPVQQYQLCIRIKSLTYTYTSDPTTGNNHLILHINHFNNSCAEFNTQLCSYVYTNRQHIGAVIGLDYHYGLNKVVSLSKDNTIRIWSYFSTPHKKSTMSGYKLSQQYQFLLSNGNSPYSLSVDSSSYVYIGFDEGLIRKIDLNKYEIVEQKSLAFRDNNYEHNQMSNSYNNKLIISEIKVAKNNKNLLACIEEINNNGICVNTYVVLTDNLLNIIYKYNAPIECQSYAISGSKNYSNNSQHQMKVMAGFCEIYKKMYICWVYGQVYRVQIYSITSDVGQCCGEIFLGSMPTQIRLIGEQLHTFGKNNNQRTSQGIYEIYSQQNGQLLQAITTGPYTASHTTTNPLILHSNTDQQIQLQLLQQSNIKQTIDMPQAVNNIIIHTSQYTPQNTNQDIVDINGVIFCSGVESHALYALAFDLRNVCVKGDRARKEDDGEIMEYQRAREYNMKSNHIGGSGQEDQLECVESKLIKFSESSQSQSRFTNKTSKTGSRKNVNGRQTINLERVDEEQSLLQDQHYLPINQKHNGLKGLYQKQQKIYEQCKQFINPQLYSNDNEDFNVSGEEYTGNPEYSHHRYIEDTDDDKSHSKKGVQIMYGWHPNYSYNTNFNGSGNNKLIWNPSSQTAIFLNQRSLILHRFSQPIEQKILRLPTYPTLVTKLSNKYVSATLSNQIRLYSPALDYIRSFTSLGQSILSVSISNCEGYLIIVSNTNTTSSTNMGNKKTKLSKCYIQIVDIVTGSTLCSTYRNSIENAVVYVNPYQQSMQFVLVTIDALYFYRVTSILTLQTQELQGLNKILSTTDMGAITCTRFIKLAEEELLLLGMQDGSVIIIDSRSNSILLLYRKIVPQQITGILFSIPNSNFSQNSLTLTLMTKSNTIYIYKMLQPTLDEFIRCIDQKSTQQLTTDSQICLFSDIEAVGTEGELAILVTTKLGVLWLIDISNNTTIKILTVHNNPSQQNPHPQITKALQIPPPNSTNPNLNPITIITGSQDGTVKSTSLSNLQQQFEIYRPRRSVRDLILANDMLIVCFNLEICCYVPNNSNDHNMGGNGKQLGSQWRFVGSVDLADEMGSTGQRITSIKNIAYTDTYIISTTTKLLVMYHQKTLSTKTKKLKVQLKQINKGFNNITNINVCGYNNILVQETDKISVWTRKQKRGQNPIQQLSKIEDIIYYTMDVYQIQTVSAVFVGGKVGSCEYLLCLRNKPILQWRDFQQHAVVRELEIGVSCPKVLRLGSDGTFLVGDEEGSVWQIKQNGLTLNKVKVFDSAVEGIYELLNKQIMAYGPGLAIINI